MKTIFTLVFAAFFGIGLVHTSQAQEAGLLSGRVKDESGAALGFGTVAIMQAANGTVVTGGVTDAAGKFLIKAPAAGTYFLRLSAIGYTTHTTAVFTVTSPNFAKDFGTLTLKPDTKQLQEVAVKALRPTIVTHPDKMVVSVEGTALAAGNTAYDVLARSPGVFVDQDGNIQLNGKAGVRIMLDGKISYLSGKELQTLLQGMSAENLKDLEIITNPSAKYDAEGTAGIININLKKNQQTGFNGNVYSSYQYNSLHSGTLGGTLNYKKGNWNSFATLDMARRVNMRQATLNRQFKKESVTTVFNQQANEDGYRYIPALRLGTDYDINPRHSIGIVANLLYLTGNNKLKTDLYQRNGNLAEDSLVQATNLIKRGFNNGNFNVHYMGKLDSLGSTLTADLDWVLLRSSQETDFYNSFRNLAPDSQPFFTQINNQNPSQYNIYSAKVDYTRPFTKTTKVELGAKASYVASDNDLKFNHIFDGRPEPDAGKSNHFIYKENIYAAYANFSTQFGPKWSVQGGLRAEQTVAKGYSVTQDSTNNRNYLGLFPSVFIAQKVSKDYQVTYNYSRRIGRPRYESLNPFVFYIDPYTTAQGNPYLRPQYTHSFQVTQTIRSIYNLTVNYAFTKDFIAEIPEQDSETRKTVFRQSNVDKFENISATLVAPVKVMPQWEINNNLTFTHQYYMVQVNGQSLRNEQATFYAQSTSNIQLPRKIRMEVNLGYQGPRVYGLFRVKENWGVDIGLKRSVAHDKLDLNLNFTDIFRTRRFVADTYANGNTTYINQYFGQQSVILGLRYRFNKGEKFEMKKRNTNLEELNRAGGN